MMSSKLALQNVKNSFRDYAIYFLTITLGVCVFYVFSSIESQKAMMVITESMSRNMETLQRVLDYLSVFVAAVLGFLIIYANRFLVRRRKKELAVYQILGMEKGRISRILIIETVLVAVVSLAAGLFLGVFLSQGFAVLTASLFEAEIARFKFIFSSVAAVKSIIYFGIAFLLVMIFNYISVGRQRLLDLLYAERKNEKFRALSPSVSAVIFIVSVVVLGIAYKLALDNAVFLLDKLLAPILLGIAGTFLFFFSLSGFFLKVVQRSKRVYFKNLNIFVMRQVNSKINTAYLSITMVCLMLFLSICALSAGTGLSKVITSDLNRLHPFDATFTMFAEIKNRDGAEPEAVKISLIEELGRLDIPVEDYASEIVEVTFRNAVVDNEVNGGFFDGYFITLSDYNRLLAARGLPPAELGENEFIINCLDEDRNAAYFEYFSENTAKVLGAELTLKETTDVVLYNTSAVANYGSLYVLTDRPLKDTEVFLNMAAVTYVEPTHEYNDMCTDAVKQVVDNIQEKYQTRDNSVSMYLSWVPKIDDIEDSKSTAILVSYWAVYLGIVFSIVSAVVLSITQLSEASDNSRRYELLRKLGTDSKMINKALFTQIAIYFVVPLFLAVVHSVFGITLANKVITLIGKGNILRDSLIAAAVLVVVYGGYFMATYLGSRRVISRR